MGRVWWLSKPFFSPQLLLFGLTLSLANVSGQPPSFMRLFTALSSRALMSGGPQSLIEIVELLCLTWSEMAVMTCVGALWGGGWVAATNTVRQEKKLLKTSSQAAACFKCKCWRSGNTTFPSSYFTVTGKGEYWLFIFHSTVNGRSSCGRRKVKGNLQWFCNFNFKDECIKYNLQVTRY